MTSHYYYVFVKIELVLFKRWIPESFSEIFHRNNPKIYDKYHCLSASGHRGKYAMAYLTMRLGPNRIWGLRNNDFKEPGLVEHSPRSPDFNQLVKRS